MPRGSCTTSTCPCAHLRGKTQCIDTLRTRECKLTIISQTQHHDVSENRNTADTIPAGYTQTSQQKWQSHPLWEIGKLP